MYTQFRMKHLLYNTPHSCDQNKTKDLLIKLLQGYFIKILSTNAGFGVSHEMCC